jgi:hypothetical protein
MDGLREIVREEVRKYAGTGKGINLRLFPLLDDENQTYAVNAINYPDRDEFAFVVVLARIVGNKVVIEEDATDKHLIDALLQRGVPREQIVLAYDGEPEPTA